MRRAVISLSRAPPSLRLRFLDDCARTSRRFAAGAWGLAMAALALSRRLLASCATRAAVFRDLRLRDRATDAVVVAVVAHRALVAERPRFADAAAVQDQRVGGHASTSPAAARRTAAARRRRDRRRARCRCGWRRAARDDRPAGRARRARGRGRRWRSCGRRRAARRAPPSCAGISPPCCSTTAVAMPTSDLDLARKKPVDWICGSSSAVVAPASARGVRVAREQRRRDLVHALVGALRGEDGRDEQLERVAVVQLGVGVRMLRFQLRQDAGVVRRRGLAAFLRLPRAAPRGLCGARRSRASRTR